MSNPRDLFLHLLGQMLWFERQLVHEALPSLVEDAKSESLVHAFEQHLEQTREHVQRVEQVFHLAAAATSSVLDPAAERLIAEHDELSGTVVHPILADVFHAFAAARAEHHELGGYEALIALAQAIDLGDAADLLEQNRRDEEQALALVESTGRRLLEEVTDAH